jgi:hypothetical protein
MHVMLETIAKVFFEFAQVTFFFRESFAKVGWWFGMCFSSLYIYIFKRVCRLIFFWEAETNNQFKNPSPNQDN